jgi:Gamma-glutamyltranspeptidase
VAAGGSADWVFNQSHSLLILTKYLPAWSLRRFFQALRLAFADTRHYCADPDVVSVPVAELLSDAYAHQRAQLFDPERCVLVSREHAMQPAWSVPEAQSVVTRVTLWVLCRLSQMAMHCAALIVSSECVAANTSCPLAPVFVHIFDVDR